MQLTEQKAPDESPVLLFVYKENHALDAWFSEAYGGEQEIPATTRERSANCSKLRNRDSSLWDK